MNKATRKRMQREARDMLRKMDAYYLDQLERARRQGFRTPHERDQVHALQVECGEHRVMKGEA